MASLSQDVRACAIEACLHHTKDEQHCVTTLTPIVNDVLATAAVVEAKVPNPTLDYEELSLGVQQLSRNALNITVVMPFCSNDAAFLK